LTFFSVETQNKLPEVITPLPGVITPCGAPFFLISVGSTFQKRKIFFKNTTSKKFRQPIEFFTHIKGVITPSPGVILPPHQG
jgi:hypothetical protein